MLDEEWWASKSGGALLPRRYEADKLDSAHVPKKRRGKSLLRAPERTSVYALESSLITCDGCMGISQGNALLCSLTTYAPRLLQCGALALAP
jgi:hypothetical protein